jgi:hypothetical protein
MSMGHIQFVCIILGCFLPYTEKHTYADIMYVYTIQKILILNLAVRMFLA